jgi:serine O-acetyltransferase
MTSDVRAKAQSLRYEDGKPLPKGDANENPKDIRFRELLREDFRTHGSDPRSAGFWALAVHRLGNARMDVRPKLLRAPLTALYRTAYHAVIALWGIDLPYNSKIGRRFHIQHHGGLHLGAQVVGDDVRVRHSATIGLARRTERSAAPVIGNRVEIGPGACIVGNIHVGDDCYVGANTVLADDLPPGRSVLGVPARTVALDGPVHEGKHER